MISTILQAREFDAADRLEFAAENYEAAVLDGSATIENCIDLIVLYFVCLDPGYAASHKLGNEFLDLAFQRINKLPQDIEDRFGPCCEAIFWREYAMSIITDDCTNEVKWRECVEQCHVLAPIIYFFDDLESGRYAEQLNRLRREVFNKNTARARYIDSILVQVK